MSKEATPVREQLGLFGGSERVGESSMDQFPEDIQDALRIVTGGEPPVSSSYPLQEPSTVSSNSPTPQNPLMDARLKMLKKSDKTSTTTGWDDPNTQVFDLANSAEVIQYKEIMKKLGEERAGYMFSETAPVTLLDPNCPRGFRVIVVLKWFKPRKDTEIISKPFDEVTAQKEMARASSVIASA